ncbi:MAG: FG-GAP-like repeat-containing protein [Bacteroidales bacterium]
MLEKKISYILLLLGLFYVGCNNKPADSKEKSLQLMTSQTMGLAYLEEFKLDEAEKEFLKYIELSPNEKFGYANLGLVYLRMGKYPEAKEQLAKAIKIDSKDADIRLLLATVFQVNDERQKAIDELNSALVIAPNHVRILYDLSELYSSGTTEEEKKQRKACIEKLVEIAPANLVPQLSLIEILIADGKTDEALERLEIIHKQFPEFPKEAVEYYDKSRVSLKKRDKENSLVQFTIFHNYLKVSSPYQAGIMDLKGPGGSLIGFPVITYNKQTSFQSDDNKSLLEIIKFTDVTTTSSLDKVPVFAQNSNPGIYNSSFATITDYDGDGDADIYAGNFDPSSSSFRHFLLKNESGRFSDVSKETGLNFSGKELSAIFADYDNDGFTDLFVSKENGDILLRYDGKSRFSDVTNTSKAGSKGDGVKSLFFDADHDGDLDIFENTKGANKLFRNNGDGTFIEMAQKMGLSGNASGSVDAAFGDFDEDEDIDLVVVSENSPLNLYSNQRQGIFKDIAIESGLENVTSAGSVAVGDFNNDGFLDILLTTANGLDLYQNSGNGNFKLVKDCKSMFSTVQYLKALDAAFFDFDNDGMLDIVIAGEPLDAKVKGLMLFHNEGNGKFKDVSKLLPDELKATRQVQVFDYNEDGDLDILVSGLNGGINLLRNDGGNANHYVKMKLVGLRAGSAKNNHFGIGAKIEMRAGDLYQSMVVTDPDIQFGIGNRKNADVIRITWTNGVPQNIFTPGADQSLIEAQTLKGSCPFIYSWNGEKFVFVKDITWRSALGMPLGIMGGTTKYAFPDASDDYIKIPGDVIKPLNGEYTIQVTSELWETIYMDKVELIAIDHPDSVDVYVPEQFTPPPFPGMKIFEAGRKFYPVSAFDSDGNEVTKEISKKDDIYVTGFKSDKYQGTTEMHSLILDPGTGINPSNLVLYLTGWIFPTDASINVAISQSDRLLIQPPVIEVINKKGNWEQIEVAGFPMGKDKTVIVDLTGKFLSGDRKIRIRTNMEVYWDEVFFAEAIQKHSYVVNALNPVYADIHYRGFSESFRKGGRFGPHWFDYYKVDKNKKWHDLEGNYTRYGDVLSLLKEPDNQYIISNAGDETTIKFNTKNLPALKKGWKRDFLIHSIGWVKDGDLNTAYGQTVSPLPYHGMKNYPPSATDNYPKNAVLQEYNKIYNTRVVRSAEYKNSFKAMKLK